MKRLLLVFCFLSFPAWACEIGEPVDSIGWGHNKRLGFTKVLYEDETAEEVTFKTTVKFNGWRYIDIWFNYGHNGYLGRKSQKVRLYSRGEPECIFSQRVTGLVGKKFDFGFVRVEGILTNGKEVKSSLSGYYTKK